MLPRIDTQLQAQKTASFALLSTSPVAAQGFCIRGEPRPTCSTFLIFEVKVHRALIGNERIQVDSSTILRPDGDLEPRARLEPVKGFAWVVGAEVGLGYNVSPDWAIGATIGWEALGGDRTTAGPRKVIAGRARRWLDHGLALDLQAGSLLRPPGGRWSDPSDIKADRACVTSYPEPDMVAPRARPRANRSIVERNAQVDASAIERSREAAGWLAELALTAPRPMGPVSSSSTRTRPADRGGPNDTLPGALSDIEIW